MKFVKFLRSIRIPVYVVVLFYVLQVSTQIAMDLIDGNIGEALLYKGFSVAWAILVGVFNFYLTGMLDVIEDILKQVKALGKKGYHKPKEQAMPALPPGVLPQVSELGRFPSSMNRVPST